MKPIIPLTLMAFVSCVCGAETPELFEKKEATPVLLAKAVNHFVAQGEEAAVKELNQLAAKGGNAEEIGWGCRILFQPKGNEPLRDARYGGLLLPINSMPLKDWPIFPLVKSGDSYFVLAKGRMLAGLAEPASRYISYCRANGVFLRKAVPIPTREKALADAKSLKDSPAWKAIKWKDSGQGFSYTFDEEWIWANINRQAEAIR